MPRSYIPVTAIMPTRGRSEMAAAALECWRWQTLPNVELVIVDDDDCPSFPDGIEGERIQYCSLPRRLPIGRKRNCACSVAAGEYIAHWDSDDWSAPGRLAHQLATARAIEREVIGFRSMKATDGTSWGKYSGYRLTALGTSVFYRRALRARAST